MVALRTLSSVKTASRCSISVKKNFTALSNNPVFYSQVIYNRTVPDYHLNNPMVNNNGSGKKSDTEVDGEKLYIDNSHLKKRRDPSNGSDKFEPTVYSPDLDDIHTPGGNIIT